MEPSSLPTLPDKPLYVADADSETAQLARYRDKILQLAEMMVSNLQQAGDLIDRVALKPITELPPVPEVSTAILETAGFLPDRVDHGFDHDWVAKLLTRKTGKEWSVEKVRRVAVKKGWRPKNHELDLKEADAAYFFIGNVPRGEIMIEKKFYTPLAVRYFLENPDECWQLAQTKP